MAFGVGLAIVVTTAAAPSAAAPATPAPARPPHVLVIGDSILTAVLWDEESRAILGRGLDLELDVGICRRLVGSSCPFEGTEVPTLVDVVNARGTSLGSVVLVEAGYNDVPTAFAEGAESAISALLGAGVRHILWADLREWQPQYIGMNRDLRAVARRHPEVTIVEWNAYAREHYSWFQSDGTHLLHDGATAMAALFNASLMQLLDPPRIVVPTGLPRGMVGRWYSAKLEVQGGNPPYRWRATSGPLPQGLRLSASGIITGTPRRSAAVSLTFRATDAFGATASMRAELTVESRRTSPTSLGAARRGSAVASG